MLRRMDASSAWMPRRMDASPDGCLAGWMPRRMDASPDGCLAGRMLRRMDASSDGCFVGWMPRRMDASPDGCLAGWMPRRMDASSDEKSGGQSAWPAAPKRGHPVAAPDHRRHVRPIREVPPPLLPGRPGEAGPRRRNRQIAAATPPFPLRLESKRFLPPFSLLHRKLDTAARILC